MVIAEQSGMLTVEDVAKRLAIRPQTVRRWCRDGTLTAIKLPGPKGDWRIEEDVLDQFIDQLRSKSELPKNPPGTYWPC